MSNVISSAIFCFRNVDKTTNGNIGRAPVAVGQATKVISTIQDYDNVIGKTAKTAVEALGTAAKNEKLLEVAGKGLKFLSQNVNPLICVSAGVDVAFADDKKSAIIENTVALSSMFAVEKVMKKPLDNGLDKIAETARKTESIDKVAEKILNHDSKIIKNLPGIFKGVAFVVGSCLAYDIGKKVGTLVSGKVKENDIENEIETENKKEAEMKSELKQEQEPELEIVA